MFEKNLIPLPSVKVGIEKLWSVPSVKRLVFRKEYVIPLPSVKTGIEKFYPNFSKIGNLLLSGVGVIFSLISFIEITLLSFFSPLGFIFRIELSPLFPNRVSLFFSNRAKFSFPGRVGNSFFKITFFVLMLAPLSISPLKSYVICSLLSFALLSVIFGFYP